MDSFEAAIHAQQTRLMQQIDSRVRECTDSLAARVAEAAVRDWPGTDRPVHTYATGRSQQSFRLTPQWTDSYGVWRVLLNEARDSRGRSYSGYTNQGYTRRGEHTARSWHLRRGTQSYLLDTWARIESEMLRLTEAQLNR